MANEILDGAKFRAEAKSGLCGAYLFFGEEEYLKHNCLDIARKSVLGENLDDTFNNIRIYGDEYTPVALENAIDALPIFADKKLVELHGVDIDGMKEIEFLNLCDVLENAGKSEETVLIVYTTVLELDTEIKEKRQSKRFAALSKLMKPVYFEKQTGAKLEKWINAHFSHEKVACELDVIRALLAKSGSDMYSLSGEIDKLCAYVKSTGRNKVELADIDLVASENKFIGEYDFSNALLNRDTSKVVYIISQKETEDTSGKDAQLIMGSIISIFTNLQKVLVFAKNGKSDLEINKLIGMNIYQVSLYRKALRNRTEKGIERVLARCMDTDRIVKSFAGGHASYVAISRLCIEATR